MRRAIVLVCAGLLFLPRGAFSAAGAPNPVVARVGETEVRSLELQARLALLHEFERDSFGTTAAEVRRNYLARKLLPELLESEEARRRNLQTQAKVRDKTNTLLMESLKESVMAEVDAKLTDTEIQNYCEKSPAPATDTRGATRDCKRDFLSYRIALRREKASKLLADLHAALTRTYVKNVDASLAEALVLSEQGPVRVAPSAAMK